MGCGASNAKKEASTEKEYDGVATARSPDPDREVASVRSSNEVQEMTPTHTAQGEATRKEKDSVDEDGAGSVETGGAGHPAPPGVATSSSAPAANPSTSPPAALHPLPPPKEPVGVDVGQSALAGGDSFVADTEPFASTLPAEIVDGAHFTMLHFNDVYHIAPGKKEPVGGASRFAHRVKQYKQRYGSKLFFSGDAYNPSLMSTVTKGKHMVPVLNALGMECAVYGNHDFDFGEPTLREFTAQSNAPWLMSNVLDTEKDMAPAADGLMHHIYEQAAPGFKDGVCRIGVIGLAEEEWLTCVKDLPPALKYFDAVDTGRTLATKLKAEEGCDLVIALTHMRVNNDRSFALGCPEVDIVLGGHDHFYSAEHLESGQLLVKSGTDFKNLSFITVKMKADGYPECHVERIDVTSEVPEDPEVKHIVSSFEESLQEKIGKELCHLESTLDITTEAVRTAEASMGNLVTDIMKEHCGAELAFVNSGILRADVIYRPCTLTLKDLLDIIPIEDVIVKIELSGQQLLATLENGLSKWPQQEGRFLQISGMEMVADPNKDPGSRIVSLKVNGAPVDTGRMYTASTTEFLTKGCDGFTALKGVNFLIDGENGPVLPTLVRRAIEAMVPPEVEVARKASVVGLRGALRKGSVLYKSAAAEVKRSYLPAIMPVVEGRISLDGKVGGGLDRKSSIGSSMMMRAPRPVDTNSVTIIADLAQAKQLYDEAALHLPSANLSWQPETFRKHAGKKGQSVTSYTEGPGLVQVKFPDGETVWFPADCVKDDAPSVPSTPQPQPGLPKTYSIRGESAIIPKQRTMSVIMQPLSGAHGTPASKLALDERGKLQIDAQEVMSQVSQQSDPKKRSERPDDDLISAGGWSAGSLDDAPKLCALVWGDDYEAVKNMLKDARTREFVNCRQGADEVGAISVSYGLGAGANQGAFPLHFAVAKGSMKMVKLLLEYEANRDARAHNGFTAGRWGARG
eukprot:TRINITY_DN84_c0_g2_i1.p1 TRINITY_DN84_c0_g2~~TRINITY_DN84_c0_g2_i1.p1  ORF type:complete len:968 (+),score=314.51 TRINITY_DN84_c0_g2_i1:152-3055(+)